MTFYLAAAAWFLSVSNFIAIRRITKEKEIEKQNENACRKALSDDISDKLKIN